MKKKLFLAITILCMLCAFLPTFVSAENQELADGITVKADGVYIGTSETAATPDELASYGISFTAGSPAKLTLNNTTIITETGVDASTQISNKTVNSAIYLATAANIELIGKNVAANESSADRYICAVYAPNSLTVTGSDGKLEADIKNASSSAGASVYCGGAFVNSSSIELQSESKTYGLYAKTSIENSGELKTYGGMANCGVYSAGTITNDGTVDAKGSTNSIKASTSITNNGNGIMNGYNSSSGNASIQATNITNRGQMYGTSAYYGIYANPGTLQNLGKDAKLTARGNVYGIKVASDLTNEGEIDADGSGGNKWAQIGIYVVGNVNNSGTLKSKGYTALRVDGGNGVVNTGNMNCEGGWISRTSAADIGINIAKNLKNSGTIEAYTTNDGSLQYMAVYVKGNLENLADGYIHGWVKSSAADLASGMSAGIYVKGEAYNWGKLNGETENTAAPKSYGVFCYCSLVNYEGAEVLASAKKAGTTSVGLWVYDILTNSGTISGTSSDTTISKSYGVLADNSVKATDGLVNNANGTITGQGYMAGVVVDNGSLNNSGILNGNSTNWGVIAPTLKLPNEGNKITAKAAATNITSYGDNYTVTGATTQIANTQEIYADSGKEIVIENKKYTVSFNTNGAGEVSPQSTSAYVTAPTGLNKKGYILDGWYYGAGLNNKFNFSSNYVRSDFALTAKWIPDSIALTVDKDKNYTVDITTASLEGTIFVALYDGDKLVKVNEYPLSNSAQILGSFTEEGTKVKAFWWDSLKNMKPKALFDEKVIPAE